jgi:hypothetical protein
MQYTAIMKSAVIPQVRVEPELRAQLDAVLTEDETLSEFVETAVRRAVEHRRVQAAFHGRGVAALERYQRTGISHAAKDVFDSLQAKLDARRKKVLG